MSGNVGVIAAQNHAIDEYFKIALAGIISSGEGGRQPDQIAQLAMRVAIAAYDLRCQELGTTFCKKNGKI
jgi:hypothetical protein